MNIMIPNELTPKEIARTLEIIRTSSVCAYGKSTRCDCKYNIYQSPFLSEHNGCPEMRAAIEILKRMNGEEMHKVLERPFPSEPFEPIA